VSNVGKGTGNLVTGITTGVGDGVTKLGKGDVLGSLGSIGGGLGRGVGGLATGIAGYGQNKKSDKTFFGVDFGQQAEKLKDWEEEEEKKFKHGEDKPKAEEK
jgi:hypothetical protein